MSLGYASRLSVKEDYGGQLGAKEFFETPRCLQKKVSKLATWVAEAESIVVFTGAGISTACGIPDFRGPNGVWTLEKAGKPPPKLQTTFDVAKPSITHQAIAALVSSGKVSYVVSQNVDGLHLRSGIPRHKLAELHGNCFAEQCIKCEKEYIRDYEMHTVGFKLTGRSCSQPGCSGELRDRILDWDDALPEDELTMSEEMAGNADLALCLGTSLQITPACDIPLETVKSGGRLVIVNLQKTPKDKKAHMTLRAKADEIPQYVRKDMFILRHYQGLPYTVRSEKEMCTTKFEVVSPQSASCCNPMLKTIEIKYLISSGEHLHMTLNTPFQWKNELPTQVIALTITLKFGEGADEDKQSTTVDYCMELLSRDKYVEKAKESGLEEPFSDSLLMIHSQENEFVTQEVSFTSEVEGPQDKKRRLV